MSAAPAIVRIGNAQAFWGDRSTAAAELLSQEPGLDYLTMDYLAEVSMSILAVQRERDPSVGYARDFVEVVASLAPYWSTGGKCRLIVNAGGLNPQGCADACRAALEKAGCRSLKIAVVSGDDILSVLCGDPTNPNYRNLDTSAPISDVADRLVTANAYVGSVPIVEALRTGADIVITGRVADPSLTVAACMHHFGWSETDWHRLAGATVAGHLIECGTQVTGGISTDWLSIPDPTSIGFPIVEVAADGSCVVTKPNGTGGRVTEETVKEQLLYEIGDPSSYLSPDVAVSFLSLSVKQIGPDRVEVSGAQGRERPPTLKVSATYRDGYRAAGTLTIIGRDAAEKAKRCGDIVLQRIQDAGHMIRSSVVECLGIQTDRSEGVAERSQEIVLRIAVESDSSAALECFSKELMPLITAGPQGTTGYAEGRPRVHSVFRYWPCLVDRNIVQSRVDSLATKATESVIQVRSASAKRQASGGAIRIHSDLNMSPKTLRDIALARSGDKGTGANIGIIARRPEDFPRLQIWLTAERVAEFFAADGVDSVVRYELPNLHAFNFILRGVLRQGLRTDAQGKALGQRLLELPLPP